MAEPSDEEWDHLFELDPKDLIEVPPGFREELLERLHREFGHSPRRKPVPWGWVALGVLCLALVAFFVIRNHFPLS